MPSHRSRRASRAATAARSATSQRPSSSPQRDLRQAVKARWVEPRRRIAREVVRRGIKSGELREGLDADVVLDALYGPIYHRLLVPYDNAPLSDEFIDQVVDHVFGGLERSTAGGSGGP